MNKRVLYYLCIFIMMITSAFAKEYVVQKGDTLYSISRELLGDKRKWIEIAELNDLREPYALTIGQTLNLPLTDQHYEEPFIVDDLPQLDQPQTGLPYWKWVAIIFLSNLILHMVCIRASCWFSLVDTTIIRCLSFSLLSSLTMVACCAIVFGLAYLALQNTISLIATPITAGILFIGYTIGMIFAMKRIFDCKWRSIITISIMYVLISNVLSFISVAITSTILADVMNTSVMEEYIQRFIVLWTQSL